MASNFKARHLSICLLLECPTCQIHFIICRSCFRGHKYCSGSCRDFGYQQKTKLAKKKYALSADAKRDHADRNRVYRINKKKRIKTKNIVMDKSSAQSLDTVTVSTIIEKFCPRCIICGQFFSKGSDFENLDPWFFVSD